MRASIDEVEDAENFMSAVQSVERHAELVNVYSRALSSKIPEPTREKLVLLYAEMLYARLLGVSLDDAE